MAADTAPAGDEHPRARRPASRRFLPTGAALLAVVLIGALAALGVEAGSPSFARLRAQPAPAGWQRVALADGVVLRVPPSLASVDADPGARSFERQDRSGTVLAYVNATPWSGRPPRARDWAAARLDRLGDENEDVAEDGEQSDVHLAGALRGSCVADHYVTRVAHHRYEEVACLLRAHSGGAVVVVAAASRAAWPASQHVLRRVVEAMSA